MITVEARYFSAALSAAVLASADETLYSIAGVLIRPEADRIRFLATDRYRLHSVEIPIVVGELGQESEPAEPPAPFVVHAAEVRSLLGWIRSKPIPTHIALSVDDDGPMLTPLGRFVDGFERKPLRVGSTEVARQYPPVHRAVTKALDDDVSDAADVVIHGAFLADALQAAHLVNQALPKAERSRWIRMISRGQSAAVSVAYDEAGDAAWRIRFVALVMPANFAQAGEKETTIGHRAMESARTLAEQSLTERQG